MLKINENFRVNNISKTFFDRVFDKNFTFEGEAHNFWEIVYVVSGKIEIVENENIYIMSEGDIIFHAPMEFHKICSAENTSPHVLNMCFTTEGTLPPNLKNGIFNLNTEQKNEYIKLFKFIKDDIIKNKTTDPFSIQEAGNRLTTFILYLCNTAQILETRSTTASALTYKFLVKLMRNEINNNLSIKNLAEKSFVSISYIKFLFQHYAGISPKNYYNNLRIIEAKHLLEQGLSVTETANKMNFSSPNNFVRFFKSITSITPYQYKKQSDV